MTRSRVTRSSIALSSVVSVVAVTALLTSTTVSAAANTWTTVAPIATARYLLAAATGTDGRVYAIGGFDNSGSALHTVEAYTPGTNSWATVAPMPTARYGLAAATGADGRIYAIGGLNSSGFEINTVEAYSPGTVTTFQDSSRNVTYDSWKGASSAFASGGTTAPTARRRPRLA